MLDTTEDILEAVDAVLDSIEELVESIFWREILQPEVDVSIFWRLLSAFAVDVSIDCNDDWAEESLTSRRVLVTETSCSKFELTLNEADDILDMFIILSKEIILNYYVGLYYIS